MRASRPRALRGVPDSVRLAARRMPRARSGGAGTRLPFRRRLIALGHPRPSPHAARPASMLADAHGCWAPLRSVAPRRRSKRGGQANVLLRAVGMVRVRYPTPRNSRPACAGYSLLLLTSRRTSGRIVPPLPQTTVVQSRSQGLRLVRSGTLPAFAVGVPLRRTFPDTVDFRRRLWPAAAAISFWTCTLPPLVGHSDAAGA